MGLESDLETIMSAEDVADGGGACAAEVKEAHLKADEAEQPEADAQSTAAQLVRVLPGAHVEFQQIPTGVTFYLAISEQNWYCKRW